MRRALELIRGCDCMSDKGCPGCIQYTACNQYNAVLSKAAAYIVLAVSIAADEAPRAGRGRVDANNVLGNDNDGFNNNAGGQ